MFYSFLNEEGLGLDIFFINAQLALQSKVKKKTQMQVMKYKFETKKWYFIAGKKIIHEISQYLAYVYDLYWYSC